MGVFGASLLLVLPLVFFFFFFVDESSIALLLFDFLSTGGSLMGVSGATLAMLLLLLVRSFRSRVSATWEHTSHRPKSAFFAPPLSLFVFFRPFHAFLLHFAPSFVRMPNLTLSLAPHFLQQIGCSSTSSSPRLDLKFSLKMALSKEDAHSRHWRLNSFLEAVTSLSWGVVILELGLTAQLKVTQLRLPNHPSVG